tara:strand:- start:1852 stop:2049 length:198 start_codon:yes stop_codon:yes gene_type:complete
MIKFLKSLFVTSQAEKIKKTRDRKYKEAVEFQRNGKLREYAEVMKEIEDLEEEYCKLVAEEDEGR